MKRFVILLALLCALMPLCAGAESAVIPYGVTAIEDEAFAGCVSLSEITIPASVQTIGQNAFADRELPLLIRTEPQSAAMTYAITNQIDYQADTTYRALLIAQSEYVSSTVLYGTLTDVDTMGYMLAGFERTPYHVTTRTDLSAAGIKTAIAAAFADAQPQDVSLVYYSGHGTASTGALCGVDGGNVTADDLRACLDAIPGRKIVIVDACHSGALIEKSASADSEQDFVDAFLSAFSLRTRASLAADGYFVMAAAHSTQSSVEMTDGVRYYGLFTTYLSKGCGYSFWTGAPCSLYADANGDGVLTFQEAFLYAQEQTSSRYYKQTAQVWPENCTWFGFLR